MLCGKGFLAKCSGPHRSAPNLPRKSWSVPGLWANARACSFFARVLPRTPCSVLVLGKMLRSAGSRFRSTGAPKMPRNSSNQGHYTSLLYPCFKTAFCYGVVSGCFVPRVSPSSRFRPELAPKRGLGGPGLAFRTPESARKVHAKSFGP